MPHDAEAAGNVLLQYGAIGACLLLTIILSYFLIRKLVKDSGDDKKMLIEMLFKTIGDNTDAMNNVAGALRDLQIERRDPPRPITGRNPTITQRSL